MPSYTVSGTAEQFTRFIASIEDRRERLVGKGGTDRELYIAWLKGAHTQDVFRHERNVVQGAIVPDNDIVTIT